MLQSLHIQSYALIDRLDIQFHPGFSVITGETGAGKSIILGALGLLLGQRADSHAIKQGASRCVVEAFFDLSLFQVGSFFSENGLDFDGTECIIRRELLSSGKSRAFINDTPVSAASLRDLGSRLIDIHSQHQNLLLNEQSFQLNILDTVAGCEDLKANYRATFSTYRDSTRQLQEFEDKIARERDKQDFMAFQLKEMDDAHLEAGEQQALEEEALMLDNTEDIKQALFETDERLSAEDTGITTRASECVRLLQNLTHIYPKAAELGNRMDSCAIELKDIAQEVSNLLEDVNFDPERQQYVNDRLDTLYNMEKKHHVDTVEQLLQYADTLRAQLKTITDSDDTLHTMREENRRIGEEVNRMAARLTAVRQQAATKVEQEIEAHLRPLGIPNIRFSVQLTQRPQPAEDGGDDVVFLFSANKNVPLQDIAQIGSGGEIARVMLSLKALLSSRTQLPTIIFDEIDTGVSGRIAEKMALMMKGMSEEGHQVISITHLPQIAAMGQYHYRVYKQDDEQGTTTHIAELTAEERVTEIAHMLSGATLTDAAISNAKELLNQTEI